MKDTFLLVFFFFFLHLIVCQFFFCDVVCYKRESEGEVNILTPLFESTGIKTDC